MRALLLLMPLVLLTACEDEGARFILPPDPPMDVSFADEVQPIFTATCAVSGCHSGQFPEGGMDLSSGAAYANTVDVESPLYMETRVSPGMPEQSLLYLKITTTNRGARMPLDRTISARDVEVIRVWIEEGALEN